MMISHSLYFQEQRPRRLKNSQCQQKVIFLGSKNKSPQRKLISSVQKISAHDSIIEILRQTGDKSYSPRHRYTDNICIPRNDISLQNIQQIHNQKSKLISVILEQQPSITILSQQKLPAIVGSQQLIKTRTKHKNNVKLPSRFQKRQTDPQINQNITYQFIAYPKLRTSANLKQVHNSGRKDPLQNLIIINFENVVTQYVKNFWEKDTNDIKCCTVTSSSNSAICISQYCQCQIWQEFKNSLKILSRIAIIALIFPSSHYCTIWSQFLVEHQFDIDFIYKIQYPSEICGAIKLDQIRKDCQYQKIKTIIYFDGLDQLFSKSNPKAELFQIKLPLTKAQCTLHVIYFQFTVRNKNYDGQIIVDICETLLNNQTSISAKRFINISNLDLTFAYQFYQQEQIQSQWKKSLIKKFQQFRNEQVKELPEDENSLDEIRQQIINDIKIMAFERIPLLHFLVGDLIVRNWKFKSQQYAELDYQQKEQQVLQQLTADLPVISKEIENLRMTPINAYIICE